MHYATGPTGRMSHGLLGDVTAFEATERRRAVVNSVRASSLFLNKAFNQKGTNPQQTRLSACGLARPPKVHHPGASLLHTDEPQLFDNPNAPAETRIRGNRPHFHHAVLRA